MGMTIVPINMAKESVRQKTKKLGQPPAGFEKTKQNTVNVSSLQIATKLQDFKLSTKHLCKMSESFKK